MLPPHTCLRILIDMQKTTIVKSRGLYHFFTISLALWLFGDGLAGVLQLDKGIESMVMLEYPLYLLYIVGWAKIFASIALLQTKCKVLKEWAYAGYVVSCMGASLSWYFADGGVGMVLLPAGFLAYTLVSYYLWKKQD